MTGIPFTTRVRNVFRRRTHCAECGAEIDVKSATLFRGDYYCGECGYQLIERVKGSTQHRPMM